MFRRSSLLALALLTAAAGEAATTNTTMTLTISSGPVNLTSGSVTLAGSAKFSPGVPDTTGAFSATASLSNVSGSNAVIPFTIIMSNGNLTGNITMPLTFVLGTTSSATGSATITGGTNQYSGATGSFPSLTASSSGTTTTGLNYSVAGSGTVTTSGSGTGGGGGTGTTPSITAVLDAGGYTANIAQGSIFVVKGSNLSASGYSASGFPLLNLYNGVKITFTPAAGGSGTDAFMIYTYNQSGVNQLAAVLPSTLAVGTYNVTVTNANVVSAPFSVKVVAAKPGIISQDSTGTGLAVVQNFISQSQLDINRFTTGSVSGVSISPARPGQTLIAWGTGLGPVPGGDNNASAGYDFTKNGVNVQVIVGGTAITPFYAGRAPGLAGADQIDFTLPGNIATGCTVSFQISVNGTLSNPTFISIAPDANSTACVSPGFTTSQLQKFDNGGSYTTGAFSIVNESATVLGTSATFGSISGAFDRFTGFQLSAATSSGTYSVSTSGSCTVTTTTGSSSAVSTPTPIGLDAGKITVTGPSASGLTNQLLTQTTTTVNGVPRITYSVSLAGSLPIPGSVNGNIVAGTYNLNGAGGKDVGPFNASVTIGAPIVVTGGLPSTVNRSQGLPLAWTGGNANDILEIVGSSAAVSNGVTSGASFVCLTTAGAGSFTVPSSILSQLPAASTTAAGTGATSLTVSTGTIANFTAPLVAGGTIDFGVFVGSSGVGNSPTYQ